CYDNRVIAGVKRTLRESGKLVGMARSGDEQSRAILGAASRILSEEGAGALTVRRIASEAGCSTMGLYSRFGGKDGVVDELYVEGFRELCESMSSIEKT